MDENLLNDLYKQLSIKLLGELAKVDGESTKLDLNIRGILRIANKVPHEENIPLAMYILRLAGVYIKTANHFLTKEKLCRKDLQQILDELTNNSNAINKYLIALPEDTESIEGNKNV